MSDHLALVDRETREHEVAATGSRPYWASDDGAGTAAPGGLAATGGGAALGGAALLAAVLGLRRRRGHAAGRWPAG